MANIYEKLNQVKKLAKTTFPTMTCVELKICVDHITRVDEGARKTLNEQEMAVKDFLLRNGYRPKTVLHWFKLDNYPHWLKDMIKSGEINATKAREFYRDYRLKGDIQIKQEILEDIRKFVNNIPEYIDGNLDSVNRAQAYGGEDNGF